MASEKEPTLGEFLRQEREKRGITIDQVASATRVGAKSLHALEGDQYVELPAKPFIRGFVTAYCRFINLDAKEILARYDDFISKKSVERPNRESGHSGYAFEKKDGEQQSRTILAIAVLSFIAIGGIAILVLKPSLRHRRNSHLERLRASQGNTPEIAELSPQESSGLNASSSVVPTSSPVPTATSSLIPPPSLPPSGSSSVTPSSPSSAPLVAGMNPQDPLDSGLDLKADEIKHKIIFRTLADVWVRYQVDDRPIRKFIVRKEKVLILRAKNEIRFQGSNPKSITYSYNNHPYESFHKGGRWVEKQSGLSLFFPSNLAEKLADTFAGESPLEKTPDPEVESKIEVHG